MQGANGMARNKRNQTPKATPGFACEIKDDTQLGLAMLIAEFGDGRYEPIGAVTSINEACEMAENNMQVRMRNVENGGDAACPESFVIWAQGIEGEYIVLRRIATI
jgi:hypothetical protein